MRSAVRAAALAVVVVGLAAAMHEVSAMPPPPGDEVAPALVITPADPAPSGTAGGTPQPTSGPGSAASGARHAEVQARTDDAPASSPAVLTPTDSPTGAARDVDPSRGASRPGDGEHGGGWDVATVPVPPVATLPYDGDHHATTTPTSEVR